MLQEGLANVEILSSRILSSSSLFGVLAELDPVKGTLSFVIIVAAVLFVEFLFAGLTVATNDTPFQKLIPCIQKELMVAGCTAFTFKIIVNATDGGLSEDWIQSLEFADLVVPIFSFVYCGFGIFLIVLAGYQCNSWSLAYRRHLVELFDEFFDYSTTWKFHYFWWIPTRITDDLEFRIFHNIFCDTYKIQRTAFAFEEYVDKIYEEFCIEMIEIRPRDWIIVSILFCLNLVRKQSNMSFGKNCATDDLSCRDTGLAQIFAFAGALMVLYSIVVAMCSRYFKVKIMEKKGVRSIEQYHKYLHHMENSHDKKDNPNRKGLDELKAVVDEIKNSKDINKSSCEYLSIHYWLTVLHNHGKIFLRSAGQFADGITNLTGAGSSDGFGENLSEKEKQLLERWKVIAEGVEREIETSNKLVQIRKERIQQLVANSPVDGRRRAVHVSAPTTAEHKLTEEEHPVPTLSLSAKVIEVDGLINNPPPSRAPGAEEEARNDDSTQNNNPGVTATSTVQVNATATTTSSMELPSTQLLMSSLAVIQNSLGGDNSSGPGGRPVSARPESAAGRHRPVSASKGVITISLGRKSIGQQDHSDRSIREDVELGAEEQEDLEEEEILQKLEDIEINSIFPFSEPEVYLEMVQLLILFISLYSSLWISNFIAIDNADYTVITLIPMIVSSFFFLNVISTTALLKAVSEFDNDVVLEVIEQTEGSKLLAKTVREQIVLRLRELAGNTNDISEGLTALFKLFKQIDANGNGLLSREEFAEFLTAVGINFSRKKWNQIFRDIDTSHDDRISFNEFFMFVFLHDNRQPDPEELERVERLSKEVQRKKTKFETSMRLQQLRFRFSWFRSSGGVNSRSVIPTGGERNLDDLESLQGSIA